MLVGLTLEPCEPEYCREPSPEPLVCPLIAAGAFGWAEYSPQPAIKKVTITEVVRNGARTRQIGGVCIIKLSLRWRSISTMAVLNGQHC
jgi:hypothetical protein